MECSNYNKYASLYLSEELSLEEKVSFEKHIQECSDCLKNLKKDRILFNLAKKSQIKPPKSIDQIILKNIARNRRKSVSVLNKRFIVMAAAAVLAAAIIINLNLFNFFKSNNLIIPTNDTLAEVVFADISSEKLIDSVTKDSMTAFNDFSSFYYGEGSYAAVSDQTGEQYSQALLEVLDISDY